MFGLFGKSRWGIQIRCNEEQNIINTNLGHAIEHNRKSCEILGDMCNVLKERINELSDRMDGLEGKPDGK